MVREPETGDLGIVLRSNEKDKVGKMVRVVKAYDVKPGWYQVNLMKNKEELSSPWIYVIPREFLLLINKKCCRTY